MNLPLSWVVRGTGGGSPKPWWRRAPGAILALATYCVVWYLVPGWVFWAFVGLGELSWVLPQPVHRDFALHAARFGIWLGWPPHVEIRLWRSHGYFGWEPLGHTNDEFDLSARHIWHT